MRSSSFPYRLSLLVLTTLASTAACGDDVPLYAFPRQMCGETAIQGAAGASRTAAPSATLAASDGERIFWVEDNYNFRSENAGIIHAGAIAGGDDVVLATDALPPTQIVVDDEQLYWGGGHVEGGGTAIKAIDKHGGTPRIVATVEAGYQDARGRPTCQGGAVCPYRLAVDATDIYYNANHTLRRVDKRRTNSVPVTLRSGLISSIAVDATNVYWVECSEDSGTAALKKLAKSGDAPPISLAEAAGADCATPGDRLVVDDGAVYWESAGTVYSVPKAGGAPTIIAEGQYVSSLAVSGPSLYWVLGGAKNGERGVGSSGHHALVQAPKTGGALSEIIPARNDHYGYNDDSCDALVVSVDDKNVFWVVKGGVLRRPIPGGVQ